MTGTLVQVTNSAWGGGLERCVLLAAESAVDRGWRSVVAYWRGDPPPSRATYHRLRAGGRVPRWPVDLARLVREAQPDIVHLRGSAPGSLGAVAARAVFRGPLVLSLHEVHDTMPFVEQLARRVTARLPAVTIAPSRAVVASLARSRMPLARVRVMPAGVPLAPPLGPPADPAQVVYVANLWPWKGHDVLLRALAMLPATLPLHALLVGDGVERERLEKRAAALGIAHRVRFAGYVADPWAAAAGSWAYVHPTLRDAMPSAVLEAMMSGLPVVASATGGVPEVVRDGETGVLVPPGDAAALARALRDLAADRARRDRLASAARAYALAELRADRSLDELFELYDDLLS